MNCHTFRAYLLAIKKLASEESQTQIRNISYPHMKEESRQSIDSELSRSTSTVPEVNPQELMRILNG